MSKYGNCCYGVMTGPNRMFCSAQNCFCEEVFDCEDYEPIVKPITNYDRIRAMSVEEMSELLTDVGVRTLRLHRLPVAEPVIEQAKEDWLDWLRQEASE